MWLVVRETCARHLRRWVIVLIFGSALTAGIASAISCAALDETVRRRIGRLSLMHGWLPVSVQVLSVIVLGVCSRLAIVAPAAEAAAVGAGCGRGAGDVGALVHGVIGYGQRHGAHHGRTKAPSTIKTKAATRNNRILAVSCATQAESHQGFTRFGCRPRVRIWRPTGECVRGWGGNCLA